MQLREAMTDSDPTKAKAAAGALQRLTASRRRRASDVFLANMFSPTAATRASTAASTHSLDTDRAGGRSVLYHPQDAAWWREHFGREFSVPWILFVRVVVGASIRRPIPHPPRLMAPDANDAETARQVWRESGAGAKTSRGRSPFSSAAEGQIEAPDDQVVLWGVGSNAMLSFLPPGANAEARLLRRFLDPGRFGRVSSFDVRLFSGKRGFVRGFVRWWVDQQQDRLSSLLLSASPLLPLMYRHATAALIPHPPFAAEYSAFRSSRHRPEDPRTLWRMLVLLEAYTVSSEVGVVPFQVGTKFMEYLARGLHVADPGPLGMGSVVRETCAETLMHVCQRAPGNGMRAMRVILGIVRVYTDSLSHSNATSGGPTPGATSRRGLDELLSPRVVAPLIRAVEVLGRDETAKISLCRLGAVAMLVRVPIRGWQAGVAPLTQCPLAAVLLAGAHQRPRLRARLAKRADDGHGPGPAARAL